MPQYRKFMSSLFVSSRNEVQWERVSNIHDWLSLHSSVEHSIDHSNVANIYYEKAKMLTLILPAEWTKLGERPSTVGPTQLGSHTAQARKGAWIERTMVAAAGGGAAEAMLMQPLSSTDGRATVHLPLSPLGVQTHLHSQFKV